MSYADLLKDPRWQKKRLEVLSAADWRCRYCGCAERTLNVHHKHYRRGAMPWEYEASELEVLCELCHEAITEATRALKVIVETGDVGIIYRLSAYAQAITAKFRADVQPVRVYTQDQVRGIADAFSEASVHGFIVGLAEVGDRVQGGFIDVAALAKEEIAAFDRAIREYAEATKA